MAEENADASAQKTSPASAVPIAENRFNPGCPEFVVDGHLGLSIAPQVIKIGFISTALDASTTPNKVVNFNNVRLAMSEVVFVRLYESMTPLIESLKEKLKKAGYE
jgi:hypothetical protein